MASRRVFARGFVAFALQAILSAGIASVSRRERSASAAVTRTAGSMSLSA